MSLANHCVGRPSFTQSATGNCKSVGRQERRRKGAIAAVNVWLEAAVAIDIGSEEGRIENNDTTAWLIKLRP